jgi:hypothetical protein
MVRINTSQKPTEIENTSEKKLMTRAKKKIFFIGS